MWTFTRIGHRLGAAFGVLLVILLGSALIAGLHLHRIDQAQQRMEQTRSRSMALSDWMTLVSSNLDRAILATRLDQAVGDDESLRGRIVPLMGQLNQEMAASANASQQAQKRIVDLGAESATGASELLARINADRDRFVALRMSIRDDLLLGDAGQRIDKELMPSAAVMEESMAQLQEQLQRNNATDAQALADMVGWTQWLLRISSALALVTGVLLAWRVARSISRPLDEAAAFASAIATGDLSVTMQPQGRDELARLQRGLLGMQRGLLDILTQVRQAADGIDAASSEIASGNQDLSARTEQTASNLEETAASVEQLTSTMHQSADAARQANQLAASASKIAVRGGQVVDQVVTTMEAINDSSKKISDIIGVIDGIAFQTNILALNAAVEAARAGEQGRGFAVVASEVRNLAQRSAEAAKEIKGLISHSVGRVEQGTVLVDQAGSTMQEIVNSIQRVSDIVGEISSASNEQSSGVGQVSEAVSQMDQATQQNAALVEESAAAASSLQQQAAQLVQAVGRFRLAGLPGRA